MWLRSSSILWVFVGFGFFTPHFFWCVSLDKVVPCAHLSRTSIPVLDKQSIIISYTLTVHDKQSIIMNTLCMLDKQRNHHTLPALDKHHWTLCLPSSCVPNAASVYIVLWNNADGDCWTFWAFFKILILLLCCLFDCGAESCWVWWRNRSVGEGHS
jgi:hypothetical protein